MDRVNDLLNAQNRGNISGSLANLNGMLAENRTNIRSTLNNVNASSAKLGPLIDDFRKTSAQASDTLGHIDATIGEDRPDLHKAIADLRQSLDSAVVLTSQLDRTLDTNTENLDEILDNLRHITDNMNEFTETIKTRPYTLIRAVRAAGPRTRPGSAEVVQGGMKSADASYSANRARRFARRRRRRVRRFAAGEYYVLDIGPAPATSAAAQVPVTLLVSHITASHLYRDDRLVYGSGAVQLGTYEYERWAEPPAELMQDMVISSLRASGTYRSVSRISSNLRAITSSVDTSTRWTKWNRRDWQRVFPSNWSCSIRRTEPPFGRVPIRMTSPSTARRFLTWSRHWIATCAPVLPNSPANSVNTSQAIPRKRPPANSPVDTGAAGHASAIERHHWCDFDRRPRSVPTRVEGETGSGGYLPGRPSPGISWLHNVQPEVSPVLPGHDSPAILARKVRVTLRQRAHLAVQN